MIKGLFETHIEVADLERSMKFYEEVLGLQFGIKEEKRRIAIYWIGGWGKQMLGIWEKKPQEITPRHFAFEISPDDMDNALSFLKRNNLEYWNFFRDATKRPLVFGWMPAVAIGFDDPDGHHLEFIAMLPDKPRPEVGIVPWDEWNKLTPSDN